MIAKKIRSGTDRDRSGSTRWLVNDSVGGKEWPEKTGSRHVGSPCPCLNDNRPADLTASCPSLQESILADDFGLSAPSERTTGVAHAIRHVISQTSDDEQPPKETSTEHSCFGSTKNQGRSRDSQHYPLALEDEQPQN